MGSHVKRIPAIPKILKRDAPGGESPVRFRKVGIHQGDCILAPLFIMNLAGHDFRGASCWLVETVVSLASSSKPKAAIGTESTQS